MAKATNNTLITEYQKNMLRLIVRSPDTGNGWRPVSNYLWNLVLEQAHPDLTELDHENKRVRLSPEGITEMKYHP